MTKIILNGTLLVACLGLSRAASASYIETNETDHAYVLVADTWNARFREPLADLDGVPWKVSTRSETGSNNVFYMVPTNAPSTFSGGIIVTSGQVRVTAEGAGRGPITLLNGGNLVASDDDSLLKTIDLTNTVIFGSQNVYATSPNGSSAIRLHAVQVGEKNTAREVRIGRTYYTGASCVELALDGAENGAIGNFGLQNKVSVLLDGGTVRIADDVTGNIFRPLSDLTPSNMPSIVMAPAVTTFEIGSGADVALGYPITPSPVVTNLVVDASVQTSAYGFETDLGSWTVGRLSGSHGEGNPARWTNGSAVLGTSYPTYYTTNGSNFVMMRRESYMETSVDVPSEGDWCVAFDCGCRPDGSYSLNMVVKVFIDGEEVTNFPPVTVKFPFKRLATESRRLSAGSHTVRFETGGSGIGYAGMFFDCIRLERTHEEEGRSTIRKTGTGALTLNSALTNSVVQVEEGTLSADLVAADAMAFTVASGATLALVDGETNLVVNGSFEQDMSKARLDLVYGSVPLWTRGWSVTNGYNKNGPGVQGNGGNVSPPSLGPVTPVGTFTAALREYTYIEQKVNVPEDGAYRLTFIQSCRRMSPYESHRLKVRASVSGQTVVEVGSHSSLYDYERHTGTITLTKGEQTVRIEVTNGDEREGMLVYIDDVRLVKAHDALEVPLSVDLASGATLFVDSLSPVRLTGLTVGGAEVLSRHDLASRGVTLVATDTVRIGPRAGLILLVR